MTSLCEFQWQQRPYQPGARPKGSIFSIYWTPGFPPPQKWCSLGCHAWPVKLRPKTLPPGPPPPARVPTRGVGSGFKIVQGIEIGKNSELYGLDPLLVCWEWRRGGWRGRVQWCMPSLEVMTWVLICLLRWSIVSRNLMKMLNCLPFLRMAGDDQMHKCWW